ncbi:alpha/beta fold hydrolase [Citricoccus muralis]|uniref:Alpha/beta fold hydrolase n=1 Tax=Citricoccus muralis TaxID=169134 RepID=A0ABY8H3K2_9MICC|nr:alpha/beta fold hydrolase [Citricoccus muralis]WFP15713.1 alpha/beta fold hydrolase [Citricoccus muralis]
MAERMQQTLNSTVVGEGPESMVFLHGLMGRGKNFTTAAKDLADVATSLLVDLPNHGASPWTQDFSYVEMADAVAEHLRTEFADRDPEGKVTLLGHSLGGKVAMVLALGHPELIRRLIIEDISPVSVSSFSEFEHLLGSLLSVDLDQLQRRSDADVQLTDKIRSPTVRGFLLQNLRSKRTEDGTTAFDWEPNLRLLYDSLDTIGGFPELDVAPYPGPVLWLGGERSPYITDEAVEPMRALFPKVRRMTIRDAGHWLHSEKPAEFAAALRFFLTQN